MKKRFCHDYAGRYTQGGCATARTLYARETRNRHAVVGKRALDFASTAGAPLLISATMRARRFLLLPLLELSLGLAAPLCAQQAEAEETEEQDSSAGLPAGFAENYLVARGSLSPDGRFAVIYPTLEFYEANEEKQSKDAKDLLVQLKPFSVLAALPTEEPYFQHKTAAG